MIITTLALLSAIVLSCFASDAPSYDLKKNGKVIAKMEGMFSWSVVLANKTEHIVLGKDVDVSGTQLPAKKTLIVFSWNESSIFYIWRVNFEKKRDEVVLTESALQIDNPSLSKNVTWNIYETLVINSTLSYVCSSLEKKNNDGDLIKMENIRLQPFDLQNETFGESSICNKDRTTSAPSTTTAAPSPKPVPTVGNWTVAQDNYACIRLIADIVLKLDYHTTNGSNETSFVQVPPEAKVVGANSTCGYNSATGKTEGDEQIVQLSFTENSVDWFLTLNFTNNTVLAHEAADRHPDVVYYARLEYTTNNKTFPNISKLDEKLLIENHVNKTNGNGALSLFKADTTHFYRCNSQEKHTVADGFEIWTKSLRVEAFLPNRTTLMSERVCITDQQNETSDLVPIITGAALAVLVLFVLIAYLVGRARARANSYETI